MSSRFYILDVFATTRYSGNPLGVVRSEGKIRSEEMQLIAAELGFSETTFILSDIEINGGYNVRIFTPLCEVPFAGHPILGTAYIILNEVQGKSTGEVTLNLKEVSVTAAVKEKKGGGGEIESIVTFTHPGGAVGPIIKEVEPLVEALGLNMDDLDGRYPVQSATTGFPYIIVPLKDLEGIKRCRVDERLMMEYLTEGAGEGGEINARAVAVLAPETYSKENDLNVRVFCHYYGVPEDAATGSANGSIGTYLLEHRYFDSRPYFDIRVEQGYEMGRPSLLYTKGRIEGGVKTVETGGKVIKVSRGWLET